MEKTEQRLSELWNKAKERFLDNTDHDAVIEMLDEDEMYEYWSLYEDEYGEPKMCVFGCGRELDPDYDFENSCRKCE